MKIGGLLAAKVLAARALGWFWAAGAKVLDTNFDL